MSQAREISVGPLLGTLTGDRCRIAGCYDELFEDDPDEMLLRALENNHA